MLDASLFIAVFHVFYHTGKPESDEKWLFGEQVNLADVYLMVELRWLYVSQFVMLHSLNYQYT